ncbi:hypothetical protein SAMN02745216_03728 [Desulfatibacillum alkenivorans DSM 16219]|jgi:hypothetical protein|uniref:Zinc-ribbon domain-containing protein n=1 Tax=Desulfatibacillum alkenivorans DSM 16219 TaxID=1121393 RepID=A0A1M6TRD3_9BACT|nr:hypothetical protein [Desulfatibacillum alkenivorans]SHK59463.1 hypothetical protein SAMN02745216_03728 [Desulfatibacillum alkenivorans DSM 16219]
MNENDVVACLANILMIAGSDKKFTHQEQEIVEKVRLELGADDALLEQAVALVHGGNYQITPVGRFSDQVRNLEDMLLVSMADNTLAMEEKKEILHFAQQLKLTQDQINRMLAQTKALLKGAGCCNACGTPLDPSGNFCTECGAKIK